MAPSRVPERGTGHRRPGRASTGGHDGQGDATVVASTSVDVGRVGDAQLPAAARALRPAHDAVAAAARLGVVQLADGLVALPADARTREQLEWLADDVARRRRGGRRLARPADHRRPGAGAGRRDGGRAGRGVPASWPSPAARRPTASRGSGPGRCAGCARSGGRSAGGTSSRRRSATRPGRRCASWNGPRQRERCGAGAGPMRWATRAGIHIDRAACAWLIRRFVDEDAEFLFVGDPAARARRRDAVRHARRRARPRRRRLLLRDDPAPLRAHRPGAVADRRDRARRRPRRRPLRRPRGARGSTSCSAACR